MGVFAFQQKMNNWLLDTLRPYFGDVVDNPELYKEKIEPKFINKEFEFISEVGTTSYHIKHKGEIISSIKF